MFIVVVGNIADGLTFYGPIEDGNEATDWASENIRKEEWLVVKLEPPNNL